MLPTDSPFEPPRTNTMLLKQATLTGIRDGSVSVVFRRWRRPTVKAGSTLLTALGQLSIDSVEGVDLAEISESDAQAAGYVDGEALRTALSGRVGDIYRIRLSFAGADPRIALRQEIPDEAELQSVIWRLDRYDARSPSGPWTTRVLETIGDRPAQRAAELAELLGTETLAFKTNVRKLKGLGLTESLDVGYRLSPRGAAVLAGRRSGRAAIEPVP